jgi:hypothetical protein
MSAYCEACEMVLPTRRDADYHRTECHAFVEQLRSEARDHQRESQEEQGEPDHQ